MSTREKVRDLLTRAIKHIDENDGLGKVLLLLGEAIIEIAMPYAVTDQ